MEDLAPHRIIVFSFLGMIGAGTLLLRSPWSGAQGHLTGVEALFTAVSAVCVTGLTVIDISTELSGFGRWVVLILIQCGGLGIMTFSTFFVYLLGRRLSMRDREIIDTTLSYTQERNIGSLLIRVMGFVFMIEAIGAAALTLRFHEYYPFDRAVYHGIFHSISAFCNAGFSLYARSFEGFRQDVWINIILMALIVLGGLGFVVILDLWRGLISRKRALSFHAKVVLTVTFILIFSGGILFWLVEQPHIFQSFSTGESVLAALFQSITARTAGFNTLDIGLLTNTACMVLMFLMFIGAAPGSCGGGVKVTTAGILVSMLISRIRGADEAQMFHRNVSRETFSKALVIIFGALVLISAVFFGLLLTEGWNISPQESRGHFLELAFETVSAFGTVGLSMGVTRELSTGGRLLIILLMFAGRLGPLTLAVALSDPRMKRKIRYSYAKGEIMVG